ncbi:MAG: T9SS type A sorting domain-containing protein, partial [Bacteroidales bacterium]|nr:T9SS type A sorting domain-containing protein [Bacteroidales bacterium]
FNLNAYPNPAQNETTIEYALTSNANVYITVTDIMGREVVRLNEGNKAANTVNRVSLDTKNLNNGTYFYTINVNGVKETKKLVINK